MSSKWNSDMFMNGAWLQKRIVELDRWVRSVTDDLVRMEEYIALPAFGGQIIVRFQADCSLTLDQVDEMERILQSLAGDEFMVDFMGNIYRQLGIDYARLDEINERLGRQYFEELILRGPYTEQIQADARELLLQCAMPEDTPVWEIQWEENEYVLLLLGREHRVIRTVEDDPPIHVQEVNGALCEGLMRATFAAKRMGVSLGRLMLEAMEG